MPRGEETKGRERGPHEARRVPVKITMTVLGQRGLPFLAMRSDLVRLVSPLFGAGATRRNKLVTRVRPKVVGGV